MVNYLLKGILAAVTVRVLADYRRLPIQLLKIEAAKSYLHVVRMARLSVLGLIWMGLVIGLICMGVLLFHAGLFILLPWTLKAKAVLGLFLGLAYMAAGGVALYVATDEGTWMRKSGVDRIVYKVSQ